MPSASVLFNPQLSSNMFCHAECPSTHNFPRICSAMLNVLGMPEKHVAGSRIPLDSSLHGWALDSSLHGRVTWLPNRLPPRTKGHVC